jgi:hypothetical protein
MVLEDKAIDREFVAGPAAPSLPSRGPLPPPVLGLPVLAIVVYLVVYTSGVWGFAQTQLMPRLVYIPVPHLTSVAIVGVGLSAYAAARPRAALTGAAVLFVLLSLINIGQNAAMQALTPRGLPGALTPAMIIMSLVASALVSASIMLVAGAVAPALRKRSYWLIALTLWPVAGFVIYWFAPVVMVNWHLDRSSMPHLYFAALVFKQSIVFACIGYWLGRAKMPDRKLSDIFA